VLQQALDDLGERELLVLEVTVAPSKNSDPHLHPGPSFLYVLDGAVELSIGDDPIEVYRAGGWFYEPPVGLHATTRDPSNTTPAHLATFMIMEPGKPVTQMEP
jgi:quercetin dioxygenase-like cupin family protein